MRVPIALCLLIGSSVPLLAQPQRNPIPLDVVVDGVGQPLTAADFVVTESGEPISLEAVRLVQPVSTPVTLPDAIAGDSEASAAESAQRLVGIYVDEYHLADDAAFVAARASLARFVREDLGPNDLVVVLKPLDSLVSIRLTADRDAAARVIESAVPRLGDYTARSGFEQEFIAGAPAQIDAARSQIALSSVSALAAHVGRFSAGRKTLIVMSNGLTPERVPRQREQLLPGPDSIVRAANLARVAIYVVRPTPLVPDDAGSTRPAGTAEDVLDRLAGETTGFVMIGAEALASGLQRVSTEAGRYYLLLLAPAERPADGRFRPVSVAVNVPGARARARAGYALRAPAPAAVGSAIAPGLTIRRKTSTLIRTWFGQSALDTGTTRVEFVWEPAPRVAGAAGPVSTPSRVLMRVSTLAGAQVFSGESVPSGRDASVGPSAMLSFAAPAGQLLVQMDVLDAAGRVLDRDVRDLMVNGFGQPIAFGSAAVFRARTLPALRAIASGAAAAPVASREFSRADQLLVRIPVVARDGTEVPIAAQLESRFGSVLRNLAVSRVGGSLAQVELPLAGLASGGYVVAFEARHGTATTRVRLDFVVTP